MRLIQTEEGLQLEFRFHYTATIVHSGTNVVTELDQFMDCNNPGICWQKMQDMAEQWRGYIRCWSVKRVDIATGEEHNVFMRAIPWSYNENSKRWEGEEPTSMGTILKAQEDAKSNVTELDWPDELSVWYNQQEFFTYTRPAKFIEVKAEEDDSNAGTNK